MKNIKLLAMLFAFALSAGFTSCSDDDDDNTGGGTTVAPDGTNGTLAPGLVNDKRLTGVGASNIEYDEEGRVTTFTDNGYYNDGGDDDPKYIVSYNPFEITLTINESSKMKMYDVKFTKEGYIKSSKTLYEDKSEDEVSTRLEDWSLTYNDGCLTKIEATGNVTEKYHGETFKGKYTAKIDVDWNNGNIAQITRYYGENADGYTEKDTTLYTLTYGNEENTFRQYTPAETLEWGEHIEILMYLGYFGKASTLLPKSMEYSSVQQDYYDNTYYQNKTYNSYTYEKNYNGALGVVYKEQTIKLINYNKDGEIIYEDEYTHSDETDYRYDSDTSAPMETKAVKKNKKSKLHGFLRR